MSDSIKELINAFNLNNYGVNGVNTNFTVNGNKIVGLFAYNVDVARYLQRIGEEIIKQQYNSREVANGYYNLSCFPFVFNSKEKEYSGNVKKVKLAGCNDKVIRNLKIHFANEFQRAVISKVALRVAEAAQITKEKAHEWIRKTVKIGAIDESNPLRKHYLYCIAFDGKYLEEQGYSPVVFKLFKSISVKELDSRLEKCGLKKSDFYEDKDGMLYIRNVSNQVVKNVTEYMKKEIALDFRTPGSVESKVENCKNVISDLIFKLTGKVIDGYDYDTFTDKEEIMNGNSFVLIPLIEKYGGQLESLKRVDMYEINTKYGNLISDIRDKTERTYSTNYENPVYAISNKGIARLLPEIMQYPIAYNERTGHFEFVADLGPSSRIDSGSPRQVSSVSLPVLLPRLQPGTGAVIAVPAADAKNNPGPSMSGQNPDEGCYSIQNSSQSIYKSTASITLKSKDNEITNSDDSGIVLVDGQGQDFSSTDSKSELSRSESNLSIVSTSSSINDAQVYQPFSRSSSGRSTM